MTHPTGRGSFILNRRLRRVFRQLHLLPTDTDSGYHSETILKIRQALPASTKLLSASALSGLSGVLFCELPNRNLYEFYETLRLAKCELFP
jgi:hypothetical protein